MNETEAQETANRLSAEARTSLASIAECDGLEVHDDTRNACAATLAELDGLISFGGRRGPDRAWARCTLTERGAAVAAVLVETSAP